MTKANAETSPMRITLKNIASIEDATIDIEGITVIAGENNTGKSTVGKALWSLFNALFNLEERIQGERKQTLRQILNQTARRSPSASLFYGEGKTVNSTLNALCDGIERYRADEDALRELILPFYDLWSDVEKDEDYQLELNRVLDRLSKVLSYSDLELSSRIMDNMLQTEFKGQVRTLGNRNPATVSLCIRGQTTSATINADGRCTLSNPFSLATEAIYLDDPFVIDEIGMTSYRSARYDDHRARLKILASSAPENTLFSEMVAESSLAEIYGLIDKAFQGEVVRESRHAYAYAKPESREHLDIRNISTGMKTFALMKMLLRNGVITDGSTIILDEPEVHLHPEWQLVFAELIVLLHVKFGLHVLLNTHSPYFLQAIEVMSKRYSVDPGCRYYLSIREGETCHFEDVSNDLEPIYEKLASPLQRLADMESEYDD